MTILGIESSCDETAAAVIVDGHTMLSNAIASSVDLHTVYGGVVPEIAARSHIELIIPVVEEALNDAKTSWDDIDAIAVTRGPGLGGSLLVGVMTARTLAITKNKPLYGINHVMAHPFASFITMTKLENYALPEQQPEYPMLSLIVSGGHTQLVLFRSAKDYELLGQTTDDAVGEAFDKVAKIIGLPYPGGPNVSKTALAGDPSAIKLPIAKTTGEYDFSFSGLKTAVLRATQHLCGKDFTFPSYQLSALLSESQKANIAASFERTAIDALTRKTKKAYDAYQPKSIVVAGGVAANRLLREQLKDALPLPVVFPDIKLCTDNAAMIAALAYQMITAGAKPDDPYTLSTDTSLSM